MHHRAVVTRRRSLVSVSSASHARRVDVALTSSVRAADD